MTVFFHACNTNYSDRSGPVGGLQRASAPMLCQLEGFVLDQGRLKLGWPPSCCNKPFVHPCAPLLPN